MTTLPLLDLGDDPFERGVQHGTAMAGNIADILDVYLARFEAGGVDRQKAAREGETWAAFMRQDNAEYFREMEGIAQGAGRSISEIAMLNARYEITYSVYGDEAASANMQEPDGCTSFGLMPQATKSGHTIVGQNWDWIAGVRGNTLITRVRRHDKPDFVGFTEAGIVGCKMAVNEHGIGQCINGLVTPEDGKEKYRKPIHVRCREAMDANRFDRALLPLLQTNRVGSTNYLLGQAEGEIFNIELMPQQAQYIFPDQNGIVTHANHLKHPQSLPSMIERISPGTLYRDLRVQRALTARAGSIERHDIIEILQDHYSRPASVCRHEDPDMREAKRTITVAAIIIDLDARTLYASDGPPCSNELHAYPLSGPE